MCWVEILYLCLIAFGKFIYKLNIHLKIEEKVMYIMSFLLCINYVYLNMKEIFRFL